MTKRMIPGATLLIALMCGQVQAEAPAQAQTCVACHGTTGVSASAAWPNIAGQHEAYLAQQLRAMRSGERFNAQMAPFVSKLSDEDIDILAAWYAQQPPSVAANGDPDLVARGEQMAGVCSACHGFQGKPVADEWPIISGQHAAYLETQLKAYKTGERVHPLMQAALGKYDEDSFAALAAYFSQLSTQ